MLHKAGGDIFELDADHKPYLSFRNDREDHYQISPCLPAAHTTCQTADAFMQAGVLWQAGSRNDKDSFWTASSCCQAPV